MNPSRILCCAFCLLGAFNCLSQILENPVSEYPVETARVYPHWTIFSHPRFRYELPVPPGVRSIGVPEMAEKTKFVSRDGGFVITAWGGLCPDYPPRVLESQWQLAQRLYGGSASYQRKARTWFVISGVDQSGSEFYQKFMMRGDQVATFTLTYPHARLHEFDPWVSRIEERFRIFSDRDRGPPDLAPVTAGHSGGEGPFPARGGRISEFESLSVPRDAEPAGRESAAAARSRSSRSMVDITPPPKKTKTKTKPKTQVKAQSRTEADDEDSSIRDREPETSEKPTPRKQGTSETAEKEDLPYGVPVVGKPGFVYSPYHNTGMVDVVDISRGTKVKCPYTDKAFRVP